jgi:putative resolvase
LFDRADLDAYLGRPVSADDPGGRERVEALYCRVSGSTGRESLLANRQGMLRESLSATVFRVYRGRGSGLRESQAATKPVT